MTLLSSNNVIYGYQVRFDEAPKENVAVIDSNTLASELIGRQEKALRDKQLAEERARRLRELEESGESIPEGVDPDEFLGLADAIMGIEPEPEEEEAEPEPEIDYVAEAMAEAEQILADANARAEQILSEAQVNAEAMRNLAEQEGKKAGYNEGTQQAAMELQRTQQNMENELARIKDEYNQASYTLEHDIVEMCLPVFEKVFGAQLSGRKDVIFHLLDHCIMNIERTAQMQIKVSEANIEYMKSKKEEILSRVGAETSIDFIADAVLSDSECIIETDGGVFDCSIDTELEALIRSIKALS